MTEHSDALDLEDGWSKKDPAETAASPKRSAEHGHRRKGTPFQSAMSMMTFYINRTGNSLGAADSKRRKPVKNELRRSFHRDD